MFKRILIANRGEIAVRIIRAAKEMGIQTVAVYSEADRFALHTRMADFAFAIGPPPSTESYLVIEKIITAAKKSGAEAVHPGYGFLAENAGFARAVEDAGLVFIGPPAQAIEDMGLKTRAREMMKNAGVPVTPGTESAVKPGKKAESVAEQVGYPVLIKAASGGGGKGMRIVEKPEDLMSAMEAASREAASAFGDPGIYIEKYLECPRHIEVQLLGDRHGNYVYLNERECSIQRRHQKVIEEAPSPAITPDLRRKIGEAAVKAAKTCGYFNAGTVEFLFDKHKNFYFMEMNTRLQVEHPVTEMITGFDLVKAQIKIAAGEKLAWRQRDIPLEGHAIECRIYAEDPSNDFLPSTGKIKYLEVPSGPGIRNDSGIFTGGEISVYYDPLISKLVAWGKDRQEAIARMKRALDEYNIVGVRSNIAFCRFVMDHPAFAVGDFDTHFVSEYFSPEDLMPATIQSERVAAIAAILDHHTKPAFTSPSKDGIRTTPSPWLTEGRKAGLRSL
jgi:propionyl-CoA carboxylase alpha chain